MLTGPHSISSACTCLRNFLTVVPMTSCAFVWMCWKADTQVLLADNLPHEVEMVIWIAQDVLFMLETTRHASAPRKIYQKNASKYIAGLPDKLIACVVLPVVCRTDLFFVARLERRRVQVGICSHLNIPVPICILISVVD